MKPIIEWLQELPEPIKESAIEQINSVWENETPKTLGKAINNFQVWEETKEGYNFWFYVMLQCDKPTPDYTELIKQFNEINKD